MVKNNIGAIQIGVDRAIKKYLNKLNIRDSHKKYRDTKKGKTTKAKGNTKRRGMKFIKLLTNPFPKEIPVDYHHINKLFVIPMPRKTHQTGGNNKQKHLDHNINWIKKLYNIDINKIFGVTV